MFKLLENSRNLKRHSSLLPWKVAASLFAIYTVQAIVARIATNRARHRFRAEHGCSPVARRHPLKDPSFGVDFLLKLIRAFNEKRLLEKSANDRYRTAGTTFLVERGSQQTIFTIDPEKIKTLLAVNFKHYGLAFRAPLFSPVTGGGMFTSGGEKWAHSHALMWPTFARNQVADLELTSKHVAILLSKTPLDTTFNLQELLFDFTTDIGTEFLSGNLTDTLCNPTKESEEFSRAFNATLKDVAF
ncbi:hypothetical protein F53441_11355 [Fusarium austroafricanum]|uniref:Cytochrome P450 n=1 Tax=Fusarium austroafricanum TaxID=2364996 RepID=A0A8H4K302_9HYPO|nr:hypothetical protein F53441_11355 [Fusarium austroafricanum]